MVKKQTIISLVPSLTETVFHLGLGDNVIGRTKFCVHPQPTINNVKRYGGTKNPHIDKIIAAQPDLVLANKEENIKEHIEELEAHHIEVLTTDIKDLASAKSGIIDIGKATNSITRAKSLVDRIDSLYEKIENPHPLKVLYLIWQKPYMTIGNDTFIHDMMARCGYHNVAGDKTRYPSVTVEEIKSLGPDIIMLSSEPFPFGDKHIKEIEELTGVKAILVDGEAFSWYGSRLLYSKEYLEDLISKTSNLS